ncbi:hypothetical protein [Thiocystis violacea]|uniref:hypothetical protein n=1 Tax=Thiocystis violacea TaxID=13725 RepID=UPI0019067FF9|nr:hypothetical protein [Thiocystis violacea]
MIALTTLAALAAALPAPNAQAGDPGAAAAAGFIGGLVGGLLLGPPPPYPPAVLYIERRPGPAPAFRYGPAPPPHFSHRRHADYDGRAYGDDRSYGYDRSYDDRPYYGD